ncbi:MAG: VacJ family lipoprotein [Candidatus Rokubacteria bacterium]|nr:VacJ family lipoprotein [Candidatus Rokubacteria bacterium]
MAVAVAAVIAVGAAPAASGAPGLEPPPGSDSQLEASGADGSEVATTAAPAGPSGESQTETRAAAEDGALEEHDPWERFNERMFEFNRRVDRYVLKPVAKGWDKVVPDEVQRSLKNVLKNAAMPKRLVNNLLQGKFEGAVRELSRFMLNTTVGVGGLFDIATHEGIPESATDTGQTLGVWGAGPGPYLVLPFLPPLTVRDGIGFAIDSLLDPISYVAPFAANVGTSVGERVNERSVNLETFDDFEAGTLDLYSAVRNAYLQRRQKAIQEDAGSRREGWPQPWPEDSAATSEAP